MKILVAGSDSQIIAGIEDEVYGLVPKDTVVDWYDEENIKNTKLQPDYDVAFLGINMGDVCGIELAKQLKKLNPRINIVFVTSHEEYAAEAFGLNASGYIIKPITVAKVRSCLNNLRYSIGEREYTVSLKCFGNFEIFYNGKPIAFRSLKTKELLAYLVYRRGALCTNREIIAQLWEDDDNHLSYYKKLRFDLIKTFEDKGIADILVVERGRLGIKLSKVYCDYEDWLINGEKAKRQNTGEYMSQYSWAESTNADLQ